MGLIESDWGGTPAQSWASRPAMESDPSLRFVLDDWDKRLANYPAAKERYDHTTIPAWNKAVEDAKAAGKTLLPNKRWTAGRSRAIRTRPCRLVQRDDRAARAVRNSRSRSGIGESNANEAHAYKYRRLFAAMIEDLAESLGRRRVPVLRRATRQLPEQRLLAGAARIADGNAAPRQYRDGCDHRHRRRDQRSIQPTSRTWDCDQGARGPGADL